MYERTCACAFEWWHSITFNTRPLLPKYMQKQKPNSLLRGLCNYGADCTVQLAIYVCVVAGVIIIIIIVIVSSSSKESII